MINREKILDILNTYDLDKDKYKVISGAAMVLYGIKEETRDIDLAVSKDYYDYLVNNYECLFDKVNKYGNVCYTTLEYLNFGVDYYESDINYIEGIPVQSLKDIIKLKQDLGRDKDSWDLEKIYQYIDNNDLKY